MKSVTLVTTAAGQVDVLVNDDLVDTVEPRTAETVQLVAEALGLDVYLEAE